MKRIFIICMSALLTLSTGCMKQRPMIESAASKEDIQPDEESVDEKDAASPAELPSSAFDNHYQKSGELEQLIWDIIEKTK